MVADKDRRLLLCIFYEGPWERASTFFYGLRRDNTMRWDIPRDPRGWYWLLSKAASFCDRRDRAWVNRHLRNGVNPHRMWKRQVHDEAHP